MSVPNKFDIEGKVCVITGGSGVLGTEMAKAIGQNGGKVVLLARREEGLEETSAELTELDIDHLTVSASVLDRAELEAAAEMAIEEYGRIDVLINAAGGNNPEATTGPETSFFDLPKEGFENVLNVNLIGTVLSSQVFGKHLVEQGEGVILNVSSMNAFTPLTKIPGYSSAKAAVSNFTEWLAVHISHNYSTDIRVNAIAPGFYLTEQNRYLLIDEETGEYTDRGQSIIDHTPQGRFGDPSDLATTVLWLISPGSEFVHGTVIPIDGGFSAYSGV
ncbi:NAD(P)-dependent dehydrogenase, short-chain alcohol dehydrogenase family [Halogranum amylolyticum]|uniref:NAD(P)-dependent dehydrogenase, short-chain alcohol dehydrogenase family n=1 Tax=Halogranum amylolyticum TaxID=660520 RepID=A0A1H8UEM3_9EURY|nr:SDR family oxidoreductase [Halogranum amylolyticum]SEP01333.1 NAD(P)-dependent dehydrogenase, short-chain alcohol dehydrogenase family [Halogranum amylolyticum]